jgi:hypothetical protein
MRRRSLLILIFATLVMAVPLTHGQEIYRWVDEKGTVHFSDDLSLVPEQYRDQIEKKQFQPETPPAPPPSTSPAVPGGPAQVAPGPQRPARDSFSRKDILGRGEEYWKGLAQSWDRKFIEAQKAYMAASSELKAKEKELEDAKFKPDSLKRRLRAEIKSLEEKANGRKKEMEEARNMLDRVLPKQAEDYQADPSWVKIER